MPGFGFFWDSVSSFISRILTGRDEYDRDSLAKFTILLILYFTTARLGLELSPVSGFATFFWMPTGISLAFLLLFGNRFWPAIAIGAFLANLASGAPIPVAFGISFGNTMEAVIGANLLKRFEFDPSLERVSDVLRLIFFAAILSTTVSATIGTLSLALGGLLTSPAIHTWSTWWVGDMLSNLIIAPFILTWGISAKVKLQASRIFEALLISVLIFFVGTMIFTGLFGILFKNAQFGYVIFPPMIWIALRFGQRETTAATFLLSLIAIFNTTRGYGPFAPQITNGDYFFLQSYMATVAITFLILAASSTERKRLEKIKDEFIAVATHELKTPLTSIKAYTDIIYQRLLGSEDRNTADLVMKMSSQIGKLNQLISDLLDVTKIQEGRLKLEQAYFDVNDLIRETVSEVEPISQDHSIVLNLDKTKTIRGDRGRIAQALTNLITNSIKYSPTKTNIIVTSKQHKGKVVICVKDFGVGIEQDSIGKIFDKHYRGGEDQVTYPGMGLGLYITKEIIDRHGGEIWVKSKRGKGSQFCFSLGR